jgi:hypothetical protein
MLIRGKTSVKVVNGALVEWQLAVVNTSTWRKTYPSAILSIPNPIKTTVGVKLGLHNNKPEKRYGQTTKLKVVSYAL